MGYPLGNFLVKFKNLYLYYSKMVGVLDREYQISKLANLIIDQLTNSPISQLNNLFIDRCID